MNRLISTALAVFFALATASQAAGLYPLSNMQQFDANGKLLAGAKLYLFDGGTSTPRIGYKDSSLTSPYPNPIVADASGRIGLIYLQDGFYRQRLTTKAGVQIFDQDGLPVLSTTAGGSGTSVDPDSVLKTGDYKVSYDDQPQSGFVRANGRTIGSAASGSTERSNADTQPLYEKLWPRANIVVTGGKGANAAADYAANKPLVLPNAAGRGLVGMDDLGAGAQNIINSIGATNTVGFTGGIQSRAVDLTNLPAYVLTGAAVSVSASFSGTTGSQNANHTHSGTTGVDSPDHAHTGLTVPNAFQVPSGANGPIAGTYFAVPGAGNTGGATARHAHPFTSGIESAVHQHAYSGTATGSTAALAVNSGGSGAQFNIMDPILTVMIYIRL